MTSLALNSSRFNLCTVIVVSSFPQKAKSREASIHRRSIKKLDMLIRSESVPSQDPEVRKLRQTDGHGGWCLELAKVIRGRLEIRIGFSEFMDLLMENGNA